MTQKEKTLLLQDLCARLPYGVKATTTSNGWSDAYIVFGYVDDRIYLNCPVYDEGDDEWLVEFVKPYLRPMSSMTEEEIKEFQKNSEYENMEAYNARAEGADRRNIIQADCDAWIKDEYFLNSHHFDYRGLIPMGLALPAPEGMYNF